MPVLLALETTNRPPPYLVLYLSCFGSIFIESGSGSRFLVNPDPHPRSGSRSRFLMTQQKFVKIIILIKNCNIYSSASMKEFQAKHFLPAWIRSNPDSDLKHCSQREQKYLSVSLSTSISLIFSLVPKVMVSVL